MLQGFANIGPMQTAQGLDLGSMKLQHALRLQEMRNARLAEFKRRIFEEQMLKKQMEIQKRMQQQQMIPQIGGGLLGAGANLMAVQSLLGGAGSIPAMGRPFA